MGRIVPECDDPQIRELLQRSYRVIYRLQENTVEIQSITERQLDPLSSL